MGKQKMGKNIIYAANILVLLFLSACKPSILFDTGHFLVIVHAIPTVVLQIGKTDKQKKQINSVQYNECNL